MNEKDIEDLFTEYAESRGCRCLKLSQAGRSGWPDRTVFCPAGVTIFFEFKTPSGTGKLSRQQRACHRLLKDLGFQVVVTKSFLDAKTALDEELENHRDRVCDWLTNMGDIDARDLLELLKPEREWSLDVTSDGTPVVRYGDEECPAHLIQSARQVASPRGPELPFAITATADDFSDLLG